MNGLSRSIVSALIVSVALGVAGLAWGNGGPFVVKYPSGDPAAKGVLARIGTDLKPDREERLKVVKEDLKIAFGLSEHGYYRTQQPRIFVQAIYTIENPTDKEIEVEFGFPILRGIYQQNGMGPYPDVRVTMDDPVAAPAPGMPGGPPGGMPGGMPGGQPDHERHVDATMISNSLIYGIIRSEARKTIDQAIAADKELAKLVQAVQDQPVQTNANAKQAQAKKEVGDSADSSRQALVAYAKDKLKWNERDAALLGEYAAVAPTLGEENGSRPPDREDGWYYRLGKEGSKLVKANIGPLTAIGEQKATQFFAQLAKAFDPKTEKTYEAIFSAWGGDVKEQSVDLQSGKVRPRELALDTKDKEALAKDGAHSGTPHLGDPTVYTRIDYFDEKANITDAQKASCRAILKNLPVVFTFAPMNILHYKVKFAAKKTHVLTVAYSQYGYKDTAQPASYQFAYVVHPASFWKEFGPINLEIKVPEGTKLAASVSIAKDKKVDAPAARADDSRESAVPNPDIYSGTLKDKTGEIFLGIPAKEWEEFAKTKEQDAKSARQEARGSAVPSKGKG